MATSASSRIALNFEAKCKELGWSFHVRGAILTISKTFTKQDTQAYCECDSQYYDLLSMVPQTRGGSIWGTDGGGIGGSVAIQNGRFVMNKSGCAKRVLSALEKLSWGA